MENSDLIGSGELSKKGRNNSIFVNLNENTTNTGQDYTKANLQVLQQYISNPYAIADKVCKNEFMKDQFMKDNSDKKYWRMLIKGQVKKIQKIGSTDLMR